MVRRGCVGERETTLGNFEIRLTILGGNYAAHIFTIRTQCVNFLHFSINLKINQHFMLRSDYDPGIIFFDYFSPTQVPHQQKWDPHVGTTCHVSTCGPHFRYNYLRCSSLKTHIPSPIFSFIISFLLISFPSSLPLFNSPLPSFFS